MLLRDGSPMSDHAWVTTRTFRDHDANQVIDETADLDAIRKAIDAGQLIEELSGKDAAAEIGDMHRNASELEMRVERWNRKNGRTVDAKDINGSDVVEVLKLAAALTGHPAYLEVIEVMPLHRLKRGGLRRAFVGLQRRHGHIDQTAVALVVRGFGDNDSVIEQYMSECGYSFRQAVEHAVADFGVPGHNFGDAVDKTRKAFARRDKLEAEREAYAAELSGLRPSQTR
jgi:hypothetical protein